MGPHKLPQGKGRRVPHQVFLFLGLRGFTGVRELGEFQKIGLCRLRASSSKAGGSILGAPLIFGHTHLGRLEWVLCVLLILHRELGR